MNLSWEYLNRSQTHECGKCDCGRAIPRKGIHKWDFPCSALTHDLFQLSSTGGLGLTSAEIEHRVGVLLTNCVSVGEDGNGFGLFPVFSLLSHSCLANTARIVQAGQLTVRYEALGFNPNPS